MKNLAFFGRIFIPPTISIPSCNFVFLFFGPKKVPIIAEFTMCDE